MAKTTVKATATDTDAPKELTAKTVALITAIREPFTGYVTAFNTVLQTAKKIAPPFMRAANAWMTETGKGFVHFVQHLDPSVPTDQKGYRDNSTFNRAMYLKNLVNRPAAARTEEREGPAALPPLTGLARIIAAIKPFVPEDQLAKLWDVIADEMHWDDAQRTRLVNLVEEASPLFGVRAVKGSPRPVLRIAVPRHRAEVEEAA